jgi:serine O-acetyltransferase
MQQSLNEFPLNEGLVASIRRRDPASTGWLTIVLCSPGLHAVALHRINHWLWGMGLQLPARLLAYCARMWTGIEIHPAAKIGRHLLIDHGSGVVIGETAEIGDSVTIYQGVTLGGTSHAPVKRHPTIGDHVVIGAGAKVLGAITIGAHSRVGANAVVLADAPPHSVLVGVPARTIRSSERAVDAADLDPSLAEVVPQELAALQQQLSAIQQEVSRLTAQTKPAPKPKKD